MTVNYEQFMEAKKSFIRKHESDWRVETSPMDKDGKYSKTYLFADGAQWIEVMRSVYRKVESEVEMVKVSFDVKLFETEAWNTDDARSIFYYEKF